MSGLNLPKFRRGLSANFINLASKNSNTFYFTTDTKELFIGDSPVGYRYHELNEDPSEAGILGHIYRNVTTGVFYIFNGVEYIPLNQQSQFQGVKIIPKLDRPSSIALVDATTSLVRIYWNDPAVYSMTFGTVDTWVRTACVIRPDRYPENVNDGTLVGYSTTRNQFSASSGNPFEISISGMATLYISLFAQSANGDWTTRGGTSYTTVTLYRAADLDEYMSVMRAGGSMYDVLKSAYQPGTILPFVSHTVFTQMTYMVVSYDYKGYYNSVSDYLCGDSNRNRNVILYPMSVPSLPSGAQLVVPFDLFESLSAISIDTEFVSGKTYYTNSGCTSVFDVANANEGDTPASLQLYEKGRIDAANNGYGDYSLSFIRQWLNSDESAGNWYVPNSIFEPSTYAFAENYDGFYKGLDSATKGYIHYVRNRYFRYDNTDVVVDDRVFIPNVPQIDGSSQYAFDAFKLFNTDAYRIIRAANGTSVYGWTSTQPSGNANKSIVRNISADTGKFGTSGKLQGGQMGKDCAVPVICLA